MQEPLQDISIEQATQPKEPVVKKPRKKRHISIVMTLVLLVLILWSAIMFVALFWAFMCTFKDTLEFKDNLFGIPRNWTLDNYIKAWNEFYLTVSRKGGKHNAYIEELFLYSLYYTLVCAFTSTFVPCITAYVCAKFPRWITSRLIYSIVIVCMVIPVFGSTVSELEIMIRLGLYNTLLAPPFLKSSFLGMYFIMFYGVFKNTAKDFQEAAFIDGANEYQVMFKISLPLVTNMWIVMFVMNVMGFWNDYSTPMFFMPEYPTVAYGLFAFTAGATGDASKAKPTVQFAAAFLVMLPVLIPFIIFRNQIIGKLNINGGLKG